MSPSAMGFDPTFGTATQALDAMRRGVISSRELTAHAFARIRKHNPGLNLFITLAEDQAMARAAQADASSASGKLHGLPITIKDVFATAGIRTTSGSRQFAQYVPDDDAVAVARLKAAGAIILGKTNVPEFAADWQAFNEVAGTSNNPWDVTRTTGGSTGGGAAAVASGFTFLELGGDLSGSVRIPSHFCGVYGHRPSIDVVPVRGHIPPPPGTPAIPFELPTPGPIARAPEDLLLALEVLGGPDAADSVAYRWTLPAPRQQNLRDYRIGCVIDDPFCAVDAEVKDVLANAIDALRKAGAQLSEGWPYGVDAAKQHTTLGTLMDAFFSIENPHAAFTHRDWLLETANRLAARAAWQAYFETHDAFLMPVSFVAAFPHDHRPFASRRIGDREYFDIPKWTSIATLTGLPATSAPVGRTKFGLPAGVQIIGPFLEDATPIDIAMKLRDVIGGFVAPPRFAE